MKTDGFIVTGTGSAAGILDARIEDGPEISFASADLIQEVVTLMFTADQSARPITHGMHIHPDLSEGVGRAFRNLMPPTQNHQVLGKHSSGQRTIPPRPGGGL
jgi:hypothetical protein